jgi:hypothetical protein
MDNDEEIALSSAGPTPPGALDVGSMMACGGCGRVIHSADIFCRHCGKPQAKKKSKTAWYYEPVWIFILGFAVIGPLALPLVIKSPKLSRGAKWGISLAIIVYTALGVYVAYAIIAWSWGYIREFNEQMDSIY